MLHKHTTLLTLYVTKVITVHVTPTEKGLKEKVKKKSEKTKEQKSISVLTNCPKTSCMGMPTLQVLLQELQNSTPSTKGTAKIYIFNT